MLFAKETYVSPIFTTPKKNDPRPKWNIYMQESDRNKKCLSGVFTIITVFYSRLS